MPPHCWYLGTEQLLPPPPPPGAAEVVVGGLTVEVVRVVGLGVVVDVVGLTLVTGFEPPPPPPPPEELPQVKTAGPGTV
jgi:hypothetical protein